ncbi:hypothetical protein ACCO45_005951 [Purpureocillium lilacinum]|uniref:Uncharacterized protein n=1 Tax=Purpureocillium lilacinum TaxID=33203 RepID=A0ACC4DY77_PURLI
MHQQSLTRRLARAHESIAPRHATASGSVIGNHVDDVVVIRDRGGASLPLDPETPLRSSASRRRHSPWEDLDRARFWNPPHIPRVYRDDMRCPEMDPTPSALRSQADVSSRPWFLTRA